jgi:cobalt-zinc-cadmium efflux system outer membrane protein
LNRKFLFLRNGFVVRECKIYSAVTESSLLCHWSTLGAADLRVEFANVDSKHRAVIRVAAGVLLTIVAFAGLAAETNTLSSLVEQALRNNPELKFYEAEIAAAKANRKTAGTWQNPELKSDAGQMWMIGDQGPTYTISVMQPFEWPGRLGLRKAIANRDVELAQLGLERFRLALASRVRTAGYGLFAAEQKGTSVGEVAERLRLLRDVLVQRDAAGVTSLLETRVIEAMDISMQRKASEATVQKQTALFELNQLRGLSAPELVTVSEPKLTFAAIEDADAWQARAQTNNFEVRMRVAEAAQSGLRISLARNERFPGWSIGPVYLDERMGENRRMLGASVSLPLPLWNRNAGNIAAAESKQSQAGAALQIAQREVERKVADALARYKAKLGEMNRWRIDSIEHFRQAADLADQHYRLGSIPVSSYVEMQRQYLEAVEAMIDARKEAFDAWEALQVLTGAN